MDEFPGNSRRIQEGPPPKPAVKPVEKQVKKVISGEAKIQKKSIGKRLLMTFVGSEDAGSVWSYIIHQIVVPATKDMVVTAVSRGIDRAVNGETNSGRNPLRPMGGVNYQNYGRYGGPAIPIGGRPDPRVGPRPNIADEVRTTHQFEALHLPTRVDAQEILDTMYSMLADYQVVTMMDLFALAGLPRAHTDNKWGWFDLAGTQIIPVRGGYLLDLPKPVEV